MPSDRRPVHEIKLGRVRASIWSHGNGPGESWFSVSISRRYRDGETWKSTASFGRDELPLVAKAAEMAYAWIWNDRGEPDATS